MDTPTGLGAPFWVRGRIIPTRTGPVPSVSPTAGPAGGGAADGGLAKGASVVVKLQPARVNASPLLTSARLVIARRGFDDPDTILMDISRRDGGGSKCIGPLPLLQLDRRRDQIPGCSPKLWHFRLRLAMSLMSRHLNNGTESQSERSRP